jgi:rhodanese-related sulfurtransferase
LQVKSADEYAALMEGLNLPNPKMMDVAVPANMRQGLAQEAVARRGWAITAAQAIALPAGGEMVLVDLREAAERARHGCIPGAVHLPYPELRAAIAPEGSLGLLARAAGKRLVFCCAYGERSAMAVQAAQDAGLSGALHVAGGMDAWRRAGGEVARP